MKWCCPLPHGNMPEPHRNQERCLKSCFVHNHLKFTACQRWTLDGTLTCIDDTSYCIYCYHRQYVHYFEVSWKTYFIITFKLYLRVVVHLFHLIFPPGESISSETSNGYLNDPDASLLAWQAFEEEPESPPPNDLNADADHQRSLLLSHTEALAGKAQIWPAGGGDATTKHRPQGGGQGLGGTHLTNQKEGRMHPSAFGMHILSPLPGFKKCCTDMVISASLCQTNMQEPSYLLIVFTSIFFSCVFVCFVNVPTSNVNVNLTWSITFWIKCDTSLVIMSTVVCCGVKSIVIVNSYQTWAHLPVFGSIWRSSFPQMDLK